MSNWTNCKANSAHPAETPVLAHLSSTTWQPSHTRPLESASKGAGSQRWQKWASGPGLDYALTVAWKSACHITTKTQKTGLSICSPHWSEKDGQGKEKMNRCGPLPGVLHDGIPLSLYLAFLTSKANMWGLPQWLSGKESACQCRAHGFDLWSGKIPCVTELLSPCTTTTDPVLESLGAATAEPADGEPALWNRRSHRDQRKPVQSNGNPAQA